MTTSESGFEFPEKGEGQSWVVEKVYNVNYRGATFMDPYYLRVKLVHTRLWFFRKVLFSKKIYLGVSWDTMDLEDLFGDVSYSVEKAYSKWLAKNSREEKIFGKW